MARTSAQSLLKTVSGRKLAGIAVLLVTGNAMLFWQSSSQDWAVRVADLETLATGIAVGAASQVDGDAHRALARAEAPEGGYATWSEAPDAAWMHHVALAGLREEVVAEGEFFTLNLRDDLRRQVESYPDQAHAEALEVLFTSADPPRWRAPVDYSPSMRPALFGGEGDAPVVVPQRTGTSVIGYAPIRDSVGNTVGLLAVDLPLESTAGPHTAWQARLLLLLGGLTLALLVLLAQAGRRLAGGLTVLEAAGSRLASGDLSTAVSDRGYAEVGSVSRVLEEARAALARREAQLRTYAESMKRENELLEKGLDAATRRRRNALLKHNSEISATITVAGEASPVRLVDLSYDFVLVHARTGLSLVPGTPLELELLVSTDRESVRLACIARGVEATDEAVALRLVSRHSTQRLRFPRRLVELTRLRQAQRARPKTRHPISVACGFGDLSISGSVVDLSAAGMAVMTSTSVDTLAAAGTVGRIRFDLPGPSDPIQVRGTLLRMQETSGGTLLGFGFRFRGRRGSAAHQQTIQSWVEKRIREEDDTLGPERLTQTEDGTTGLPV